MAKFEVDLYRQFRISYPLCLFESLKPYCQVLRGEKLQVLDLGAGTGLATRSFLQFYPDAEVTLVEPDANMLDEALRSFKAERPIRSLLASAESFHLPKIFDLALIASAWHWMSPQPTLANLTRVLKPGGAVWLAEYQFPKAMGLVGISLNEWVRREFNLRWKPQSQVPRGSLDDLIAPFRRTAEWSQVKSLNVEEMHSLSLDHFLGVIFSQSRYLAFEVVFSEIEKVEYRAYVKKELSALWGDKEAVKFSYTFQMYVFRQRNF